MSCNITYTCHSTFKTCRWAQPRCHLQPLIVFYLYRRHEEVPDEVELTVNGLRMDSVVLPLLRGVPDHLDRLDPLVDPAPPVQDPHLVEVGNVVQADRALIRHHYLQYFSN